MASSLQLKGPVTFPLVNPTPGDVGRLLLTNLTKIKFKADLPDILLELQNIFLDLKKKKLLILINVSEIRPLSLFLTNIYPKPACFLEPPMQQVVSAEVRHNCASLEQGRI